MRKIIVPPGIGDIIWLLQKLVNTGERFDFALTGNKPRRGHQILELLPQTARNIEFRAGLTYKKIQQRNVFNTWKQWRSITDGEFYLSMNEWLEDGKRIEHFFPEIPVSYEINWASEGFASRSIELLNQFPDKKYIGIYGSSYSTARAWNFWDEYKWMQLIREIKLFNSDYVFVVIGAEWDLDLGRNLVSLLHAENIDYINTIGENLGTVIEIMKRLKYFFSFPSGLGILAPTVNCPVTMFYPPHLEKMMNAWADPRKIESGEYKGCQFCEPQQIFEWVLLNNKI